MTWTFHQKTGVIDQGGKVFGRGYAGKDKWRNNPNGEQLAGEGPLPKGRYHIEGHFHGGQSDGELALGLHADRFNQMYGRHDFSIHGEVATKDGKKNGGHGQPRVGGIVLPLSVRMAIFHSNDRELRVVA